MPDYFYTVPYWSLEPLIENNFTNLTIDQHYMVIDFNTSIRALKGEGMFIIDNDTPPGKHDEFYWGQKTHTDVVVRYVKN